ncbi:hypothetical protein Tco_0805737 [Tanacetum coccineum]
MVPCSLLVVVGLGGIQGRLPGASFCVGLSYRGGGVAAISSVSNGSVSSDEGAESGTGDAESVKARGSLSHPQTGPGWNTCPRA